MKKSSTIDDFITMQLIFIISYFIPG